jgi:hypothetical protein
MHQKNPSQQFCSGGTFRLYLMNGRIMTKVTIELFKDRPYISE